MSYGKKIKELRKTYNLTQEELANKIFVSRQAISLWEQEKASPSKESLLILQELFGISIDEWLLESEDMVANEEKGRLLNIIFNKKNIIITLIVLGIVLLTICCINLVNRYQILYPKTHNQDIVITRKSSIIIKQDGQGDLVYSKDGKPNVYCKIPSNFEEDENVYGLYHGPNGSFIKIDSEYDEKIFNPLYGTKYYDFYQSKGYMSYNSMIKYAMYNNYNEVTIFSSKDNIFWAGGARIIRDYVCAGKNVDMYPVDGGLTEDETTMRISGIALHFDDTLWQIILRDYKGYYYIISVKDPDGIGDNQNTISDFLRTITVIE